MKALKNIFTLEGKSKMPFFSLCKRVAGILSEEFGGENFYIDNN